jgi:hypothetical protein
MNAEQFNALTPDGFEKLTDDTKQAAVEYNNLHVLIWRGNCQRCGTEIKGTLAEIKGRPCPECGYGATP